MNRCESLDTEQDASSIVLSAQTVKLKVDALRQLGFQDAAASPAIALQESREIDVEAQLQDFYEQNPLAREIIKL